MRDFLTHPNWTWLVIAAVGLGFIASSIFVTRYLHESGRAAWRNPFGKFLLVRESLLTVLFGFVMLNQFLGEWPGRRPVLAILMIAFALHAFVPYRLLLGAQKARDKEEAQAHE